MGESPQLGVAMTCNPIITADDVIRAGACSDGVYKWLNSNAGWVPAAMPAADLLKNLRGNDLSYVIAAAALDGYGDGYGDGDGDGYGYGYGYGYGSGDGYGSADGYGDGGGDGLTAKP